MAKVPLVLMACLVSINTIAAEPIKALSKPELEAFCSNQQMWGPLNVENAQCMKAATECSVRNEGKNISLMEATQALYACVFEELGIEVPSFDE